MVPYNDGLTFNCWNGIGFYVEYSNEQFDSNRNIYSFKCDSYTSKALQ